MHSYEELKNELVSLVDYSKDFPTEIRGKAMDILAREFMKGDRYIGDVLDKQAKVKISHETLLSELHNVDKIAETHSSTVLAISAALISIYALKLTNTVLWIFPVLGILVSIELFFKVLRYRDIFRYCHEKISSIEGDLKISGVRPAPKSGYSKSVWSKDGFTILLWLAVALFLFWGVLLVYSV